jgi:hypothetical protein
MTVFNSQLTPAQAELANHSPAYESMVLSLPPSPTSPVSPSLEALGNLLAIDWTHTTTKNASSLSSIVNSKILESDGQQQHQHQHHRRRLPIFVRLTEREARRRQRILLARALITELITHRRDIIHFKRIHTNRLKELEHERVAPMEAAAAAVMAAAAAAAPPSGANGRRSGASEQQFNGKTARAAAAARQRARLSPAKLSKNRALSERAVAVLQAADQLEERGRELLRVAKSIIAIETGKHQAAEPVVVMTCDSDDESDASMSDNGSDDTSSMNGGVPSIGQVMAQLDKLALAVEQLRDTTTDFICAYPA